MKSILFSLPLASAGTVLWSGLFNETFTVDDFDDWSWSNQIEPYQWYIHGSNTTSHYLGLSPDFKNPNSTLEHETQGIRITIDDTSSWNGQPMMRSELIPQTSKDLGSGKLFYHFSLQTREENFPTADLEHQIAFFESHFTELKYGGASAGSLAWFAGGAAHWSTTLEAGTWYNFAYAIDFGARTVGLYASLGADALQEVVAPVSASTSTNSADWHVGELRLDNGPHGPAEDWYWSGVYVESGAITTEV
ncbi:hypothetical protein P175DRAFT_0460212 [Aspergillus ochraceoroseus IBT 24754]|uniref:Glycoside hydrolase 131 catalytic N-terminal domain-containing protein n=2 Tax=Aspergillus ochraceoroseus TaxID=138278 RepID=A0A2T5LUM3_9EURO|nr:uncharacterized protein P175DRAFT_0460212 [Aspergillus ochraceoroseus IBT 24754]KKK17678.1 hypothetical protein AOCH_000937 [Aspergillus ochraceoroseus]PTU19977.1 hypothetical protein P175DRAFT_0460212 [Aspergillus ochraceoroseus IBT 24754]